jgi:hypothetical protein
MKKFVHELFMDDGKNKEFERMRSTAYRSRWRIYILQTTILSFQELTYTQM